MYQREHLDNSTWVHLYLIIVMTFLLLYVRAYASIVRLYRFMEVKVASCTPSEKDPPVPIANFGYVSVDKSERRVPTRRRPQSGRQRAWCVCVCA
jgi:hypothetical protein